MKYALATSTWDDAEIAAINKVIASDRFTMGGKTKQFEAECANYFGSQYCVMVNSGSSANLLSVAAASHHSGNLLRRGGEVIVPAVSWATTYSPLWLYGMKLRFVDVSLDSLNMDLDAVEEAINDETVAIYAVNLLGAPNNFVRLQQICDKYNLTLLEDNCESMGAKLNGDFTGTFGISGSMSTFFSHHLCTIEGGLILTDDEETYQLLMSLRSHGWTREDHHLIYHDGEKNNFKQSFNFILPGYNLRPTEISAALGLEQLKKLDNIINERRKNAQLFIDMFGDSDLFTIQKPIGKSSWFGFAMILRPEFAGKRDDLAQHLINNEIETRPIVAGNFIYNDVIKYYDYKTRGLLENAKYLDQNGLFVGNNHYNLENELTYLKEVVDKWKK